MSPVAPVRGARRLAESTSRRRRASTRASASTGPHSSTRSARSRCPARPGRASATPGASRVIGSLGHRAPPRRKSASSTSSSSGRSRPSRSRSSTRCRSTRSNPRADSRPRSIVVGQPARDRAGQPELAVVAAGRRHLALRAPAEPAHRAAAASRAATTRAQDRRRRLSAARPRGSAAPTSPDPDSTRRSTRSSSGPESRRQVSATGQRRALAGRDRRPVSRTGTGWRPGPAGCGPDRWRRRRTRWIVTSPSSSGWRRPRAPGRRTPAPRRGSRTPRWASDSAPGPGQAGAAADQRRRRLAVWCGAWNGGRRIIGAPGGSVPAIECTAVTSSAAASSSGGRTDGSRCASMVLPAPGGPTKNRW